MCHFDQQDLSAKGASSDSQGQATQERRPWQRNKQQQAPERAEYAAYFNNSLRPLISPFQDSGFSNRSGTRGALLRHLPLAFIFRAFGAQNHSKF
jgi:hypothetical protein